MPGTRERGLPALPLAGEPRERSVICSRHISADMPLPMNVEPIRDPDRHRPCRIRAAAGAQCRAIGQKPAKDSFSAPARKVGSGRRRKTNLWPSGSKIGGSSLAARAKEFDWERGDDIPF
jgi:hypothetical protein